MIDYNSFVDSKRQKVESVGFDPFDISEKLFPFQRMITDWAIRRGRAAIFSACGTGKTAMELEWARNVSKYTDNPVLILAPLAVARQTQREGEKFDVPVTVCRYAEDIQSGVNITNYERLHHFKPETFAGLVADESSILKNFTGKMRQEIIEFGYGIKYRLAATATPAPNDLIELANHSEFLSIMHYKEITGLFFTQDHKETHKFRLKGHAREDFWQWLGSWSIALRMPSDIGFEDDAFILPELWMSQHVVDSKASEGMLFPVEAIDLNEQRAARRASLPERVEITSKLVDKSNGVPWVLWCDLNLEQKALERCFGDNAISIYGSLPIEVKESRLLDWLTGKRPILITKPSIAGFGINMQHCANMAFVGISHSYEQFYQAIRRCWRFGQKKQVNCHIITSKAERKVLVNIKRKEQQAEEMMTSLIKHMSFERKRTERETMKYEEDHEQAENHSWEMYLGDTVELIDKIEDNSIGVTVTSPPFPGMYVYTNSPHDMGNSKDIKEMIEHFKFLITKDKLMRITMPGRLACIHLMQVPTFKYKEGYCGIKDFRGAIIETMINEDWIYAGEVTIDKNPQVEAIRTKEQSLLFKTLSKDSSKLRMALADYLIYFRKPGDNLKPILAGISDKYNKGKGWITQEEWIEWAAPVWYRRTEYKLGGIKQTDVLNVKTARENDDERHLCPLQLGVIERAIKLWSAPGEIIFDPFTGIGSTGVVALNHERRFIGVELKKSYYEDAIKNLKYANKQHSLF